MSAGDWATIAELATALGTLVQAYSWVTGNPQLTLVTSDQFGAFSSGKVTPCRSQLSIEAGHKSPKIPNLGKARRVTRAGAVASGAAKPGVTLASAMRIMRLPGHSGPRERASRIARSPTRAALFAALASARSSR